MRENTYQARLIKRIKTQFPGCMVLKNDTDYIQGIPDLLVLIEDFWAALEVKASRDAPYQPNQEYYISEMGKMSFAASIHPGNEGEVLDAIQQTLRSRRLSRFP